MCCRYFIQSDNPQIREIYERLNGAEQLRFGDVFPSHFAPVLTVDGPSLMQWGVKGRDGRLIVNARAESVGERPMWRRAFELSRCLVPASGFYEWDGGKKKHCFADAKGELLCLCGLVKETETEKRFVILTASAYPPVSEVHARIPVIADKKTGARYLASAARAREIIASARADLTERPPLQA